MKLTLPRRLLIGAALGCVVVGVLLIIGLRAVRPLVRAAALEHQMGGIDHAACVAAPERWGWRSGEVSLFAYSRAGRSSNPEAPPLEPSLRDRALQARHVAVEQSTERLVSVVPHAPDGPCALIRATSRNPDVAVQPRFLGALGGAIGIGMVLSVLGTFWLIVLPLRRRIETLAEAAQHVGEESYSSATHRQPDALGNIAEVLGRSHDRIVEARETLTRRNQALEKHLAGIAHDLRTPLSSMHLALEALAEESDGDARSEARRALADAVYLSSMVENLHQATRLRQEVDVTSGQVELADLTRRIERRFDIVGRHAEIEVAANTPEHEVWVSCTPAFAERAISNLVQNAIEHNGDRDQPGHVAITLDLIDAGRRFALVVADDGPGLPDEELASLNDESFLGDGARPRGPGMGMLITSEVARRAGWSLSYEAMEPSGLRVRLEGSVADAPTADG
ncbi:MAG: HAMP domain-containing sensor histidine kinase [Sandaracinaceae bacterium]